jgi:hypothetical protein
MSELEIKSSQRQKRFNYFHAEFMSFIFLIKNELLPEISKYNFKFI